MRDYTSPKMKVQARMEKYGLSFDEAEHIIRDDEDVLTFDELKIRYDCENLGELPNWLTEDELDEIIKKGVNEIYDDRFIFIGTREEIYQYMHVFVRERLHTIASKAYLYRVVTNRTRWLLGHFGKRCKYHAGSINNILYYNSNNEAVTYADILTSGDDYESSNFLQTINSIKQKDVKSVLIVVGYLVCNLDCLRGMYLNLLRNHKDPEVIKALKDIENQIIDVEEERFNKVANRTLTASVSYNKILDIIKALKLNVIKTVEIIKDESTGEDKEVISIENEQPSLWLDELRTYLTLTGIG